MGNKPEEFLISAIFMQSHILSDLRGDGSLEEEEAARILAALKNCLTLITNIRNDTATLRQQQQPNMLVRE